MAEETEISWTATDGRPGNTFNPWLGCQRVSPGCEKCYAETFVTKRMGLPVWGPSTTTERKRTAPSNWKKPLAWNRTAEREGRRIKVFCSSLADVFEDNPQVAPWRRELFQMIEATPHLDWLLLTKRPEHMKRLAEEAGWPSVWPAHVWAGTTVDDQRRADERIPHLLQVPARVRFLSCEPLLEDICIEPYLYLSGPSSAGPFTDALGRRRGGGGCGGQMFTSVPSGDLSWVICGGESGPGARPFDLGWARALRDQCGAAQVPFFMKQMGSNAMDSQDYPSPVTGKPYRLHYKHPKGGDMAEWPEDLRVREFPL